MTRKAALIDLRDKVASGEWDDLEVYPIEADGLASWFFTDEQREDFFAAYEGSLDAALALHNDVLPGWLYMIHNGIDAVVVKVCRSEVPEPEGHTGTVFDENPARAWLLSILSALIAECDE